MEQVLSAVCNWIIGINNKGMHYDLEYVKGP